MTDFQVYSRFWDISSHEDWDKPYEKKMPAWEREQKSLDIKRMILEGTDISSYQEGRLNQYLRSYYCRECEFFHRKLFKMWCGYACEPLYRGAQHALVCPAGRARPPRGIRLMRFKDKR